MLFLLLVAVHRDTSSQGLAFLVRKIQKRNEDSGVPSLTVQSDVANATRMEGPALAIVHARAVKIFHGACIQAE